MRQTQNGPGANAEEGGYGSDDDSSSNGGMMGSPRWSRVNSSIKGWRLRGVEWRVKLGVLPRSPSSVDDLRRAAADGRRRYADLRRRLLVDPHLGKNTTEDDEGDTSFDDPLSQKPESVWGRYFRNAELEKTIDKDLTRLYPEHGVFFQSSPCQKLMRRILLVWSLIHPQFSYRQGMHELLAPLLYVLHVDVVRLSEVKYRFEDLFDDRFDTLFFQEEHVRDRVESSMNYAGEMTAAGDALNTDKKELDDAKLPEDTDDEQRVDLNFIIQGSDMYGVEGELGALLSTRFLEHDAYCMLDALLSGHGGAVSMAAYFTAPPGVNVPPVIEASASVYRSLAAADNSLYTHLVELGVEPQFFALRWLRLLFGREFVLEDLLRLWDAILAADNTPSFELEGDDESNVLRFSGRSALISSVAVAMLLYVRPGLLSAPDATACLQRLLNFPQVPDVGKLIETANSLLVLAQAAERAPNPIPSRGSRTADISRNGKHVRSGSISPPTAAHHVLRQQRSASCSPEVFKVSMSLPGSYWEEKWTHSVLRNKSPEELFGAESGKVKMVAKVSESFADSSLDSLSRSASEGRRQRSTSNAVSRSLFVSPQDGDGHAKSETTAGKVTAATVVKDHSAESVDSTSDCDGSRDSDKELRVSGADGLGHEIRDRQSNDAVDYTHEVTSFWSEDGATERCRDHESEIIPSGFTSSSNPEECQAGLLGFRKGTLCFSVTSSKLPLLEDCDSVKVPVEGDSYLKVEVVIDASCQDPGTNLKTKFETPSAVHSMADEGSAVERDTGDSSSCLENAKSKFESPSQPTRLGRLNWIWSLGRSSLGVTSDKTEAAITVVSPANNVSETEAVASSLGAGVKKPKRWWRTSSDVVPEECVATTSCNDSGASVAFLDTDREDDGENTSEAAIPSSDVTLGDDTSAERQQTMEKTKENNFPTALQALGQAMLEHVQVLESSLSHKASILGMDTKMWSPAVRERSDSSKSTLGGKSQAAALAALAELRKISNALQQM